LKVRSPSASGGVGKVKHSMIGEKKPKRGSPKGSVPQQVAQRIYRRKRGSSKSAAIKIASSVRNEQQGARRKKKNTQTNSGRFMEKANRSR